MMPRPHPDFDEEEQPPWEPVVFPKGWNAVELLATDFPPVRWAVPDLVPEGLTLLVGAPKLGKSWFALNIATAIASGGRALGKIPVEQGEAIYLALEDNGKRLKSRIEVVLEGDKPSPGLHLFPEWPMLHDGGLVLLDAWLTQHPDCRLVVIDVFARVRGRTSGKEDRYDADYGQMSPLKQLADKFGVAIVVVHHTRKAGSEDYMDLVSGTNGIAGAADTIMILARHRGNADAKLHLTGRDLDEAEHALKLNGGRWTLLDGPSEDYEMSDTRRRIKSLLTGNGAATPKVLASLLHMDYELVKKTCQRMAADNQLTVDRGTYSVVPVPAVPLSLTDPSGGQGDTRDTEVDEYWWSREPEEAA